MEKNKFEIDEIRDLLEQGELGEALARIRKLNSEDSSDNNEEESDNENIKEEDNLEEDNKKNEESQSTETVEDIAGQKVKVKKQKPKKKESIYPPKLRNEEIEKAYIGLLLNNPKLIAKYYIIYDECYFDDESLLNIYKSILFTEGGNFTPEIAKKRF